MSEPLPPAEPDRPAWQRPLAYFFLLAGALLTFFNSDLGRWLNISNFIIQLVALGVLLAGATLFYRVRETFDRRTTYRQAFNSKDAPEVEPTEPDQTDKPAPPEES